MHQNIFKCILSKKISRSLLEIGGLCSHFLLCTSALLLLPTTMVQWSWIYLYLTSSTFLFPLQQRKQRKMQPAGRKGEH